MLFVLSINDAVLLQLVFTFVSLFIKFILCALIKVLKSGIFKPPWDGLAIKVVPFTCCFFFQIKLYSTFINSPNYVFSDIDTSAHICYYG